MSGLSSLAAGYLSICFDRIDSVSHIVELWRMVGTFSIEFLVVPFPLCVVPTSGLFRIDYRRASLSNIVSYSDNWTEIVGIVGVGLD